VEKREKKRKKKRVGKKEKRKSGKQIRGSRGTGSRTVWGWETEGKRRRANETRNDRVA